MRLTAEMSVVCLSVDVRSAEKKLLLHSARIRALIWHLAGGNLAASMRITRGSHYNYIQRQVKSLR